MKTISKWDNYQGQFNENYLRHQEIYYDEGYYGISCADNTVLHL
jgi:hypothetical protein